MLRIGRLVVLEEVLLEAVERYGAEEPRRHDPVGIDIVAPQRHAVARQQANRSSRRAHAVTFFISRGAPPSIVRTSTTSPATAAAATIAGLIRSVRPVGLP